MFLHYLVKLVKIGIAADFNGILHVRPQNSSCEIRDRLNSSGLEDNAAVLSIGSVMSAY